MLYVGFFLNCNKLFEQFGEFKATEMLPFFTFTLQCLNRCLFETFFRSLKITETLKMQCMS